MLPRDQIPEEVLEEIYASFSKVTWDNYGKNTRGTSSKRLRYRDVQPLNEVVRFEDPFSFLPTLVHGFTHMLSKRYAMRGYFNGWHADIYYVYESAQIPVPKDF